MTVINKFLGYMIYFFLRAAYFFLKAVGKKKARYIISKIFAVIGPFTKFNKRASYNINYIWPKLSEKKKQNILLRMWETLGVNIGEFIFLGKYDPFLCKETKVVGKRLIEKIIKENQKKNKGIIFFSAHFGSWEKIPIVLNKLGLEILSIYRKSNNNLIDKFIQNIRSDFGNYTPKGDKGAKKIFLWLRKGKSVALLMDQKLNEGVKVNFLNKPAYTATAIAELAIRMNLDIVPIKIIRKSANSTEIVFFNKIKLPKGKTEHQKKVRMILESINLQISSWIKKNPEQWLWIHRRWHKSMYKKNSN